MMFSHSCGIPKIGRYLVGFYVPVFFVVTGYLYRDGSSFKTLVKKRAKQILLPYFAVNSVLLILTIYRICTERKAYIAIYCTVYIRGVLWTVYAGNFFRKSNYKF